MSFDRYDFLDQVLAKAKTKQAVLDVLGLPSSRGPNLFNREHKRPRYLSAEDAIKLSEAFGVPLTGGELVSAESLLPVLRVCLRHPPEEWTDQDVQRLASEIEYGLRLKQAFDTSPHAQDRGDQVSGGEAGPSPGRRA